MQAGDYSAIEWLAPGFGMAGPAVMRAADVQLRLGLRPMFELAALGPAFRFQIRYAHAAIF